MKRAVKRNPMPSPLWIPEHVQSVSRFCSQMVYYQNGLTMDQSRRWLRAACACAELSMLSAQKHGIDVPTA